MKKTMLFSILSVFALLLPFSAIADTTDVKWMTKVEVKKTGPHCVNDKNCFNRYHPDIPAVAKANPGDMIILHTRDALDTDFTFNSVPADVAAADLNLVHPMTGPVHINGAKRGDAIEVEIVDVVPDEYGWTVIVPGFGFMRDVFPEPYIINWQLTRTGAVSSQRHFPHLFVEKTEAIKIIVSGRFHQEKMAVIWMCSKCKLEHASYSPVS